MSLPKKIKVKISCVKYVFMTINVIMLKFLFKLWSVLQEAHDSPLAFCHVRRENHHRSTLELSGRR